MRQDNQCYYYNKHTKELPELHRNQAMYAQDPMRKTWNPARVVDQGDTPRSYIIKLKLVLSYKEIGSILDQTMLPKP